MRGWWLALGLAGAAALAGCAERRGSSSPVRPSITLFIPCGMTLPFKEARAAFLREHPGVEVIDHYNNAPNLVREILKEGRRPDIMVSPGKTEMAILDRDGLVRRGSLASIGTYTLSLVVPSQNRAGVRSLHDLVSPRVKTVIIATPEQNSVGAHSRETLVNLGYWERIRPKVVFREHALEVVAKVAEGKADAALAYKSCPLQSAPEKVKKPGKVKIVQDVPSHLHSPIQVQVGILRESKNPRLAREFIQFLLSPKMQARLAALGLPNLPSRAKGGGSR